MRATLVAALLAALSAGAYGSDAAVIVEHVPVTHVPATHEPVTVDRVVVFKQLHKLVLFGGGREISSYRIALGSKPLGPKQKRGDLRTPEGSYTIDARNAQSQYYKAFHISYPNAEDLAKAQKLGLDPGGDIMLHGLPKGEGWLGKAQALHDWTHGCIAVSNQEMDELWQMIPVGTPIDIKP